MLTPMLATPADGADLSGSGWLHEFKWDGIRVLVHSGDGTGDGSGRITSRNGNDVTAAWPELEPLMAALPPDTVVDGELVVLDDDLRPDFSLVAQRMHVRDPLRVARLRGTHPGQLMAFDLLRLAGEDLVDLPLERRRGLLEESLPPGGPWAVPPASTDLATMTAVAEQRGLEGTVSKRLGSRYEPGVRSRNWRKTRRVREADAVVVGHRGLDGATSGPVTSLALARRDPETRAWVGEGSVGSGLGVAEGRRLRALFDASPPPPGADLPVPDGFVPTAPEVVVRISYLEATPQGHFRHPVYKGQRPDVAAEDVTDAP